MELGDGPAIDPSPNGPATADWSAGEGLGDVDLTVELARAESALADFRNQAKGALSRFDRVDLRSVVVMGFIARVQGLHAGVVDSIRAENPHAAFPLLRSLAETAAAIAYLLDHPASLPSFAGEGRPVRIGKIKTHASKHFEGFDAIYKVLSDYSHPNSRGLIASHRVNEGADGTLDLSWQSSPRFKSPLEAKVACSWLWELTEAQANLIGRLASRLSRTDFP
jgi:hypothetical protein